MSRRNDETRRRSGGEHPRQSSKAGAQSGNAPRRRGSTPRTVSAAATRTLPARRPAATTPSPPPRRPPKIEAPPPTAPRSIVGVGASAGGLEALRALLSSMRRAKHMALVIVQHLAPQYRSRLVELLSHSAALRVKEIQSGERLEAGTAYV